MHTYSVLNSTKKKSLKNFKIKWKWKINYQNILKSAESIKNKNKTMKNTILPIKYKCKLSETYKETIFKIWDLPQNFLKSLFLTEYVYSMF